MLLLALVARLWQIDLTRFFNDQVVHIFSATSFIDSAKLPLSSGFTFAVGTTGEVVRIPALVTYLLTPAALVSRDPVWLSAYVAALDALAAPLVCITTKRLSGSTYAALSAGVFYALCPAALVFGRMIWNPDLVPLFAAAGLLGLVDFALLGRAGSLAVALVAIGCAVELHVVNAVVVAVWLAAAFAGWRKVRLKPLLAANLALLVTIAPYLYLETQSGWSDIRNLLSYLIRPKVSDLAAVDQAAALLGPTIYDRLVPPTAAPPGFLGFGLPAWIVIGLLVLGMAWRSQPSRVAHAIIAAWVVLPVVASLRHSGQVVPHYLLAILPAAAVLMGLALERLRHLIGRLRLSTARTDLLGSAPLLVLSMWLAVDYIGFQQRVATNIRENDYGMPLRYSLRAAELVRSRLAGQPLYLAVPFLWERTVPALAGQPDFHWYWDRSVFVFPPMSAWYLVQNDSFGHDFLTRQFSPPVAIVPNDAGEPEFSLFSLPDSAAQQVFHGPGFIAEDLDAGGMTLEGVLVGHLAAGQPSQVLLEWRITDPARVPSHLSQFAHLLDAAGSTVSTDPDLYDVREPWQPGDVVASAFDLNVRPDTPTGGYWLETGFYDTFSRQPLGPPMRIGPLKVLAASQVAPPASAPLAILGNGQLALLRAEWRGQDVAVDWQALEKPAAGYTVFVHAVNDAGKLVAQWDGPPRGGSYPTSLWDAGEAVHDVYPLGLAPSEGIHLEIGMYTQPDVRRLPVQQAGIAADHVTIQP